MKTSFDIESFLDLSGYDNETRRIRRKNSDVNTQEYFTPYSIVKRMADKIQDEDWANPEKTFLEPAAGNGQFVCYVIYRRIISGVDPVTAFNTLYATELMKDNVDEMKERCIDLMKQMEIDFDESEIRSIMEKNFICADFFEWDYREWKPINNPLF